MKSEIVQNKKKMNAQKDLFTAFKEGSEQLRMQPSPQAWHKLEGRLEAQPKPSGKVVPMRWLMAIAAMFVLLVGTFFINKHSTESGFAFGNEPVPTNLQDLVNTEGCKPYCMMLEGRKDLPSYYANPVRKW
jgi:hypothetical protein